MARKITFSLIGVLVAALLLLTGSYAWVRARTTDQVPHDVVAAGLVLDGLSRAEAEEALLSHQDALAGTPARFLIEDIEVGLDPVSVGLDLDEAAIAAEAVSADDQRSFLTGLLAWIGLSDHVVDVEVPVAFDGAAVVAQLAAWESELLTGDETTASVQIVAGEPEPVYPSSITRLDRDQASSAVESALSSLDRTVTTLETITAPSPITNDQVDEVVDEARRLLTGPITLTSGDPVATITLTVDDLRRVFGTTTTEEPPSLVITLDQATLDEIFFPVREQFPGAFQNAEFVINDDDTVSIKPGVTGPKVDSAEAAREILAAAATPARTGDLPLEDGARPDITTEDLEALGVNHLVSRFTTYHDCCANRVTNIHLIADEIDGVIVRPGDTFGINDYVGERTSDKGYLPAGTIVDGEIVDTVGGGVSQFATTFYNAVFWGGYTDVTHKPHSYYFSRYPEGIEATINWPNVELAFRNDSDNAILIKTSYTETSITVSFYSDNRGTGIAGEQSGGVTSTWMAMEGEGVVVTGSVSGRYAFTSPRTQYQTDRSIKPGTQSVIQGGAEGWSVTVERIKTHPDGRTEEESWAVRYLAQPRIVRVHPCDEPGSTETCPTTTTAPPTTTTLPPATTIPPPTTPPTVPPTTVPAPTAVAWAAPLP